MKYFLHLIPGITWSQMDSSFVFAAWMAVLACVFFGIHKRKILLQKLGVGTELFQAFVPPIFRKWKTGLYILGSLLICLATLGPQWGQKPVQMKAQGLDICFAIDLSRSMWTEDMNRASRLETAKNQLTLFLPQLGGDRAALVGFAGSAYIAAPLSIDHNSLINLLDPVSPDFMSFQATNYGSALDTCLETLKLDQIKDANEIADEAARLVVFLTDGEDNMDTYQSQLKRYIQLGVPIYSFAYGSVKGGAIPQRNSEGSLLGYIKDPRTGEAAHSSLEDKALLNMAEKTGGKVFYASRGTEAWKDFLSAISEYKRVSRDAGTRLSREERFQWPLFFGLVLLFIEFFLPETFWKKNKTLLIFICLSVFEGISSSAHAQGIQDTYLNQKALQAHQREDYFATEQLLNEALARNSKNPYLRFNWITNKLSIKSEDKAPLQEALSEIQRLESDLNKNSDLKSQELLKKVYRQKGQILESLEQKNLAIESYYRSLGISPPADFDKQTQENLARLLKEDESQKGQGGGKGSQNQQKPSSSQGQGDKNKENPQFGKGQNPAPPFKTGQIDEAQARQILESVQAEERQVQKKKAQSEAQERAHSRQGSKLFQGEENHPDHPW